MHKDDIQQGQIKWCNTACVCFCYSYHHITIAPQWLFRVYLRTDCLNITVTTSFIMEIPSLLVQYHILTKCMYHCQRKRKQLVLLLLRNPRKTILACRINHGATPDTAVTAKKLYKFGLWWGKLLINDRSKEICQTFCKVRAKKRNFGTASGT